MKADKSLEDFLLGKLTSSKGKKKKILQVLTQEVNDIVQVLTVS